MNEHRNANTIFKFQGNYILKLSDTEYKITLKEIFKGIKNEILLKNNYECLKRNAKEIIDKKYIYLQK